MKILIIATITQFLTLYAFAQNSISDTKWLVHTEMPQPKDLVLNFKKDTLGILAEPGNEIGSATFLQRNDSLFIRKVSGRSPCPNGSEGWYKIEWLENGDKFFLHILTEDCPYRVYGHLKVLKKIK